MGKDTPSFLVQINKMYRNWLSSSKLFVIFGGYVGSLLFMSILTMVGNLEAVLFGKAFQTRLIPEVILCLLVAITSSALVHRVCVTVCFISSMIALYYMNRISLTTYGGPPSNMQLQKKKKLI